METTLVLKSFVLPGLPHPLLAPGLNPGYQNLRNAFEQVREELDLLQPDVLLIYSTMWPSILGHQVQSREWCEWVHVDEEFHDLGSIPYRVKMDSDLAKACVKAGTRRGLQMHEVKYHGFPIDTGSLVALKLINPENKRPAVIFSSNIYADRAETVVLGKSVTDALKEQKKTAVAIVISTLSNRLHQTFIDPKDDKIHSLKDQEWNLKMLEFFEKGRLEDLSQLSRQIQKEARVKKVNNFKPLWWLSTVAGAHNRYQGKVLAYEAVCGTGSAVISLTPSEFASRDLEFDEDSPDVYVGERNVLGLSSQSSSPGQEPGDGDGE